MISQFDYISMSAAQGTTVHERLLHPHLGHCSSAAPVVFWLPSVACAATPSFDVRWSGLFCGRPGGLKLVTRLSSWSDAFCGQFSSLPENFSLLVLLAYTAHWGLRGYALYEIYYWQLTLTLTLTSTLSLNGRQCADVPLRIYSYAHVVIILLSATILQDWSTCSVSLVAVWRCRPLTSWSSLWTWQ